MLCQGIAAQPQSLLPDAGARLEAILPQMSTVLKSSTPTAVTASTTLAAVLRCLSSPERTAVLEACAESLSVRAHHLTAPALVSLTSALARLGSGGWEPPQALLLNVEKQLDIKRYDLAPGKLWRAAKALELLGAGPL